MDAGQINSEFADYFSSLAAACPYGLRHTATYRQAWFSALTPQQLERFLAAGFRRSGNIIYAMCCRDCAACVPIRLETASCRRSRSMARVWRRNRDLTVEIAPLTVSPEKLALCQRFLDERYPAREGRAMEYYSGFFLNSLQVSLEVAFRLAGRLVGLSVVDLSEKGLSAVYFYFAPDLAARSLGTYNILFLADLALAHGLQYLYLGYWIREVPAMAYKSRFLPHFLLEAGEWRRQDS
jgi:leucyl-tRNA---protein transferase